MILVCRDVVATPDRLRDPKLFLITVPTLIFEKPGFFIQNGYI